MKYIDIKEPIKKIFPKGWAGGDKLALDMIRDIRLLKYVRQSQLKDINKGYAKICAKKKLQILVDLKLLIVRNEDVYIATNEAVQVLKDKGYTEVFPAGITGDGAINSINNTECFIQAMKLTGFKALLFPSFGYIVPDALMVRTNDKGYKLDFLEVEASKSGWNNWLEEKRIKYLELAKDRQAYEYWKVQAGYLGLPVPDIKDFKFSVIFVCRLTKNFGQGFTFKERLL